MQNKKGFTLIELLVVLVILGLIISLMFGIGGNIFGESSVKTSAAKVADDFRAVSDAAQRYQADKATKATAMSGAATALLESGYITTLPSPPSSVYYPGDNTSLAYQWDTTTFASGWGSSTAAAVVLHAQTDSVDVCSKINELFAGGTSGATPPTTVNSPTVKDIQCYGSGPYDIVKPVYTN